MVKGQNDNSKRPPDSDEEPTFDMYHLFSRWDFVLLVIFVLLTLILTVAIIFRDQVV